MSSITLIARVTRPSDERSGLAFTRVQRKAPVTGSCWRSVIGSGSSPVNTSRPGRRSTGTGSPSYYLIRLLNDAIGTKFDIVTGYQGGQEIDLAVEKNEVQCRAFTITTFFAREPFHTWRKKGFVRVLTQTGKKRDSRLADVPSVHELMEEYKTPESTRRLASLMLASGDFGRPIIATPGIPPDRVKLLREAFSKALKDPELLEEAKKKRLEVDPMPGEDLEALAKEVLAANKDVIERMEKLLGK
jgi:tripartite-type tricarboxylate transporter receptor subunit TctC